MSAMRKGSGRLRASAWGALALTLLLTAPVGDTRVADAAQRDDVAAVRSLLREGADVNAAQADGMTALHWAARNADPGLVGVLAYAGANLEATTRLGGYTALHLAARQGHEGVVRALLEAGSQVDARTGTGATALHLAAAAGSSAAIGELLDHGADVDAREASAEQTPLIFAVANNRLDALKTLLARGADVSLETTVVDYAARAKADIPLQEKREKLLQAKKEAMGLIPAATEGEKEGGPAQTVADRSAAQLQSREEPRPAAAEPKAKKVEEPKQTRPGDPIDQDATWRRDAAAPHPEEPHGEPPPAEPEPFGYADLVGRQGGMSALHYAARDGHVEEAKALLAAGADVNEPTAGDHTTPLLIATINGNYDLAMIFLAEGGDPNLASDAGVAPLFATLNNRWAPKAFYPQPTAFKQQETSYLDLMTALIDKGAEVNVRLKKHPWYTSYNFDLLGVDFMGATPFWRAAYALDIPAMQLLVAHGADPGIPTMKPPSRRRGGSRGGGGFGGGEQQEKADPSGLPPVPVYGPGVYPIHAATGVGYGQARAGNSHRHVPDGWLPAVRYLVEELGADVNARDFQGFTPVHHAAARGDNETIQYLVDHGADVTLIARTGQTTVDMANGPQQRVQPFPETIALLESLGAQNNHKCLSCD
jgi:ankyrin repeat protein